MCLFCPVLFGGGDFVETLQCPVVPLVEAPVSVDGNHTCPIASRARCCVTTALVSSEVWLVSKVSPSSRMVRPAAVASARPCSVSGTSCHPVNRLRRFHSLWPWRRMTSVPVMGLIVRVIRLTKCPTVRSCRCVGSCCQLRSSPQWSSCWLRTERLSAQRRR